MPTFPTEKARPGEVRDPLKLASAHARCSRSRFGAQSKNATTHMGSTPVRMPAGGRRVAARARSPYPSGMAVCLSCGADLPPAARFCASCGTPVSERIADERKVITVLFADLVGSTATGSEQDPEAFGAAIRPQLARIREALERYGGTIEKYIGDAVVAV